MRDNVKGGALTEVTFFILLALYEPRHGYGIMQFVEYETQGRLNLGAGSLYGAINSLQEKGWIRPINDGSERKKEYIITETGKEVAKMELLRLEKLSVTASRIIGGYVL
jgi:DNA-binding PadR family transcriptional regulator